MLKIFVVTMLVSLSLFGQETARRSKETMAVAIVAGGPEQGFEPAEMLVGKLAETRKVVEVHGVNFKNLYDGDEVAIKATLTKKNANTLLVARLKYSFRPSSLMENGVVCDTALSYKVFSSSGEVLVRAVALHNGVGFSEASSLETALERLAGSLKLP